MKNYLDSIDRDALRSRAEQMLHTAGNACDQAGRFMIRRDRKDPRSFLAHRVLHLRDLPAVVRSVAGHLLSLNSSRSSARSSVAAFAATWLYLLWRVFFDEDED